MRECTQLVILGGGSAGWITANLLNNYLDSTKFKITLIESPDIGTIGVGEGSTPHLKRFFDILGVAENEWMPACNASYKTGISFVNWTSHLNHNQYFHPFPSPLDHQTAKAFLINCMLRHRKQAVATNPEDFFLANFLAQSERSPITKNNQKVPLNYAYHFDSALLGDFLKTRATDKGVKLIQSKVDRVIKGETGDIEYLLLETGEKLKGDLFFDASGFNSLLMDKSMQIGFTSFKDNLFNDSAIAAPTEKASPLLAQTKASALDNGWAWHIPLVNRTGNGYVYASEFCSAEEAEKELCLHLGQKSLNARHLKMKIGRRDKTWHKNVVAVGLSQGFIEPLEATAIHLVIDTVLKFIEEYNSGLYSGENENRLNAYVDERYEGIRDYIVAHYKVNTKDGDYWQANRENKNISERLKDLLKIWDEGKDITPFLREAKMDEHYPALSWYCLLAGYGRFPSIQTDVQSSPQFKAMQNFLHQYQQNFKFHNEALEQSSEKTIIKTGV